MKVVVDRAGGVVIPKVLRERLSMEPGTALEIEADGDGLRLTPIRRTSRAVRIVDGLPVIAPATGFVATDTDVRRSRDTEQR